MGSKFDHNRNDAPWEDAGPHWQELQSDVAEDKDLRRLQQPAGWSELKKLRRLSLLMVVGIITSMFATVILASYLGWFWFIPALPAGALYYISWELSVALKNWQCPVCRQSFFYGDAARRPADSRLLVQRHCSGCEADSRTPLD